MSEKVKISSVFKSRILFLIFRGNLLFEKEYACFLPFEQRIKN